VAETPADLILGTGLIRSAAEKGGKISDRANVSFLGLRRETADLHVVDHAPTQRADVGIRHGSAPVLVRFETSHRQDRATPFPLTP
jgi:hypothetical protein